MMLDASEETKKQQIPRCFMGCEYLPPFIYPSHRIHVWYIHLHLVDLCGKCIGEYTIHGSYGFFHVAIVSPFMLGK